MLTNPSTTYYVIMGGVSNVLGKSLLCWFNDEPTQPKLEFEIPDLSREHNAISIIYSPVFSGVSTVLGHHHWYLRVAIGTRKC